MFLMWSRIFSPEQDNQSIEVNKLAKSELYHMYSCTRVKHPHSSKSKTHPRRQFPWQDLVQPNMKNLIQLFIMSDLSKIPSSFCTLFLTRLRKIMQSPLSVGYIFQIGVLPCTACRCTPGSSSCTPRQGAGGSRTRKKVILLSRAELKISSLIQVLELSKK